MLTILKECPGCSQIKEIPFNEAKTKTICDNCGSYMNLINPDILKENTEKEPKIQDELKVRKKFKLMSGFLVGAGMNVFAIPLTIHEYRKTIKEEYPKVSKTGALWFITGEASGIATVCILITAIIKGIAG